MATGIVPLATGSDGAAWCGIFGLKSTTGRRAHSAAPMPARPIVTWSTTLGLPTLTPRLPPWPLARCSDSPTVSRSSIPQCSSATPARRQRTAGARTVRCHNDDRLQQLFRTVDLLVTPTIPKAPHRHDGPGDAISVALTWGFNLSGSPALSVPAGLTQAGAPDGLQLVARPGSKQLLLDLAAAASVSNLILRMSGT
ncbi:MAG TPA: amidase family protein [Pseudonocardiaceae bacterium]|nr:amidase family protein [Pseudonocardiaceae bacterium]